MFHKDYTTKLGKKFITARFTQTDSKTYSIRSWGIRYGKLKKFLNEYMMWITDCIEDFGDEVGTAFRVTSTDTGREIQHNIVERSPDEIRESVISSDGSKLKFMVPLPPGGASPDQMKALEEMAKKMGATFKATMFEMPESEDLDRIFTVLTPADIDRMEELGTHQSILSLVLEPKAEQIRAAIGTRLSLGDFAQFFSMAINKGIPF